MKKQLKELEKAVMLLTAAGGDVLVVACQETAKIGGVTERKDQLIALLAETMQTNDALYDVCRLAVGQVMVEKMKPEIERQVSKKIAEAYGKPKTN